MSYDMRCKPEYISDMKSYDRDRTEWACYVRNLTDRAIQLDIPMGVMERMANNPCKPTIPYAQTSTSTPTPDAPEPPPIITPPPPIRKQFIPGVGLHVQAYIGKDKLAWFTHGAKITRIDLLGGVAYVDPRPYAQPNDPAHCHEEPKTPIPFIRLGLFDPATKPPKKEPPRTSDKPTSPPDDTEYDKGH